MRGEVNPLRVLIKALCLFVLANIVYALIEPGGSRVSAYTAFFPGRTRLPFGIVGDPYTVTVHDLDAMFASHLIHAPKSSDEYRVALIGDSSVWGQGLGAYDVISVQWNAMDLRCGEKTIRTYNLGYPHPSVVKDLVILDKALEYEPDLVVWFVTLNSLISQRANPFLVANRGRALSVLDTYDISFRKGERLAEAETNFLDKTFLGQRSNLARRIKLQMLGLIWTATRADTNTLADDDPVDFEVDDSPRYRGLDPSEDLTGLMLFSALSAGHDMAGQVPVLLVNEPMYVVPRANTRVRYNAGYPRWAYDQYRKAMVTQVKSAGWNYLDLWRAVPRRYFLDASLHLGAEGERLLIEKINPAMLSIACDRGQ